MVDDGYFSAFDVDDIDSSAVRAGKHVVVTLGKTEHDIIVQIGVFRVVLADFCAVFLEYLDTIVICGDPYSSFIVDKGC